MDCHEISVMCQCSQLVLLPPSGQKISLFILINSPSSILYHITFKIKAVILENIEKNKDTQRPYKPFYGILFFHHFTSFIYCKHFVPPPHCHHGVSPLWHQNFRQVTEMHQVSLALHHIWSRSSFLPKAVGWVCQAHSCSPPSLPQSPLYLFSAPPLVC